MSLKTKLTSLITTFVLLCSLLTVGVFAVKNTTFNVGGDIVFNVQGIEATITRGATTGFTADKTIGNAEGNILSDITLNNNMSAQDVADEFAPWSGLNLAFSENVATIKLTITNTAEEGADNYLDIAALASATTQNNARVSVVNDAGGITALLEPQQSASFTITFSVIDDEYSASLEGFSVNFDMQKKVLADFPTVQSYAETFEFTEYSDVAPYTVSVGVAGLTEAIENNYENDPYILTGEIEIPSFIQKDNVVYTVNKVSDYAFGEASNFVAGCWEVTNIILPKTITSLGRSAFAWTGIANIIIPEGVSAIPEECFWGSSIENIAIPENVTSIEVQAFTECTSLETVSLPNSITSIKMSAFDNCSNLTTITIPNSVASIGDSAFSDCSSLTSITISESVISIGDWAFSECSSLETVNYTGTQEQWNALLNNVGSGNDYLKNATLVPNYKG